VSESRRFGDVSSGGREGFILDTIREREWGRIGGVERSDDRSFGNDK